MRTSAIVLEGHGFGHGRGMGQWGARARASNGVPWTRILDHYYGAARLGRRDTRERIRVLVDSGRSIRLNGRELVVAAGRATVTRARRIRVRRPGNAAIVERKAEGTWRRVTTTRKPISVRAARGRLWLEERDGQRAFEGRVEVRRRAGALAAINVVGLQSYLAAVVPREMPALWPMHALRAQAVAARTYAVRVKRYARSTGSDYHICATTACQVYGGAAWRARPGGSVTTLTHPRTTRAARDTAGRVLVWRGEPILAQYSSSTGGWTDSGGTPYLRAVRDRADRASPYHRWRVRVSASDIDAHWPAIGRLRAVHVTRRNGHGAFGGRARRVAIVGTRRTAHTTGDGFAAALGLRSDWFRVARTVRARAGAFTVDLGHGDRHPDVRRLQLRLRREGVYPRSAPITTYFGSITLRSLRRYQRDHDIAATGYLGPITRARLDHERYRFTSNMGYGTRSPVVRELQHRLRREGVYPRSAPRTNYFGSITRRAVERYQRAHDIRATGYLGPATRRSLNR